MRPVRPAPWWRGRAAALAVAVSALLLIVLPAAPAEAHTFLVGSNPADGQLLQTAPSALRLDFSESVVLGATTVDVVDGEGKHYAPVSVVLLPAAGDGSDTEQPVTLSATLPALEQGTYRVAWRTLSSDDLHQASGVLAFGIGEAVGAAGTVAEAPGVAEAAARWVLWGCLAGLLGPLALVALARRSLTGRRLDRLVALARWAAIAQLAATVVLPAAQLRSVHQAWLAAQSPSVGFAWGARVVGALAALLLVPAAVRVLTISTVGSAVVQRPLATFGLASGVLAVPVATAVRGHIWSTSHALVAADVVHVLAAATWAGAVASLAVVHLGRGGARPLVRSKDFALLSASCVALAVATGLLLAGHGVSTTTALLRADYGRALLVKAGLLAVVLVLAALNHHRGRAERVLGLGGRGLVLAEALTLICVLGAAGVLAATSPANSPQWTPAPAASRSVTMHADDLLVGVSIGPNLPGPGYANISVLQTRRPTPAPVRQVRLTLRRNGFSPITGSAGLQPDGSWSLPVQVPQAGRWDVVVEADRMGLPTAESTIGWVVGGGVHGPTGTDLSGWTTPLAGLVALGWLTTAAVALRSRRRRALAWAGLDPSGPTAVLDRVRGGERVPGYVSAVLVLAMIGSLGTPTGPADSAKGAAAATRVTSTHQVGARSPSFEPVPRARDLAPSQTVVARGAPTTPVRVPAVPAAAALADPLTEWEIGSVLLAAYETAVRAAPAGCHLGVSLLAAIGQVESGSLAGRSLDAAHRAVPPVLGPVLDGRATAAIHDSDAGRLDGDRTWDRAVGPLQFIPATWRAYGLDADGDGVADPQDVEDAAAAAAAYLCRGARDLGTPAQLRAAVLSYNHSATYLATVLAWQRQFALRGLTGSTTAVPRTTASRRPLAATSAPTDSPAPSALAHPTASPTSSFTTTAAPEPAVTSRTPCAATPSSSTATPTTPRTPATPTTPTTPTPPIPDPTSDPGTTTIPPPFVAPTDVADDCVPAQSTEPPVPPVITVPPGEPVLPTAQPTAP